MCGIAGALRYDGAPVDREALSRAARSIAHRGPDDEGFHFDGPVGLAHRRLSIIDLERGRPSADDQRGRTRSWLTYNGEIYNYRELRRVLEARGHRFVSHTDTEVLVHGYEEWGERMLAPPQRDVRVRDLGRRERQLLLARDRFGVKPLYCARTRAGWCSARRSRRSSRSPASRHACRSPALIEYFTFQNTFGEDTLFEGITMLPAGHVASRGATTAAISAARYYDPDPARAEPTPGDGRLAEELERRSSAPSIAS